jgi:hypothetical protein
MKKDCWGLSKQRLALTKETKNIKREKERVQGSLDRIYEISFCNLLFGLVLPDKK